MPPESDGYPEDWTTPGRSATYLYPNQQDAATLWYHDHAMGIERLNQYAGLLGVYLLRDLADGIFRLPKGDFELPLVLCDRSFGQDGQLRYPTSGAPERPWVSEVYGDAHLVNGKLFPYLDVEPRPYRFRVVNASNSRFYDLALANGATFHQIGTDQGLLAAPVPLTKLDPGAGGARRSGRRLPGARGDERDPQEPGARAHAVPRRARAGRSGARRAAAARQAAPPPAAGRRQRSRRAA